MGRWGSTGLGVMIGLVVGGMGPTEGSGQAVPVQVIEEPEVVYERDFSELRSLRPLSSGAVLAVEGIGGEVVLVLVPGIGSVEE